MGNPFDDVEYIYHYTSAEGVMGILNSKCLYATHAKFLNDYKEVVEGIDLIKSKVLNIEDLCSKSLVKYYATTKGVTENDSILEGIKNEINKINPIKFLSDSIKEAVIDNLDADVYITSFTKKRDNLSHWLTYGKSSVSYCIKFKVELIEHSDLALNRRLLSYLEEVNYTSNIDDAISESLDQLIEDVYKQVKSDDSSCLDMRLGGLLAPFILNFQVLSAMIKNSKFSSEEEFRFIIIKPSNIKVNDIDYGDYFKFFNIHVQESSGVNESTLAFRSSRSGIITPYFSVPFDVMAIDEIIIGPCAHFEDAKKGLKYYIDSLGLDIEVTESDCPYRNI
jgi:hypothetical protein